RADPIPASDGRRAGKSLEFDLGRLPRMGDAQMACNGRCLEHYLRLAKMENKRRTPTRSSTASRFLSTFESAGLAAAATFAGALWVGLALPGLPLLPGVGGGQNSNVAIEIGRASCRERGYILAVSR